MRDLLGSLTPWRRPDSRLRGRSLGTSARGKSEGSAGALSTLNSNPQARASTGNWLRGGAEIALSWFLSKDISCPKFWVLGVRRNPQQRSQDHSEGSRGCRECGPRGPAGLMWALALRWASRARARGRTPAVPRCQPVGGRAPRDGARGPGCATLDDESQPGARRQRTRGASSRLPAEGSAWFASRELGLPPARRAFGRREG